MKKLKLSNGSSIEFKGSTKAEFQRDTRIPMFKNIPISNGILTNISVPGYKIEKKVFILVNTLTSVSSFIYANHIAFFVWHAKHHPEIEFHFFSPHRMSIDNARNTAADYASKLDSDYLMFIDDDVMIPRDSLFKLLNNDKDICAGLVIIRGYPFNVMAFKYGKSSKDRRNMGFYNELPLKVACKKGHKIYDIKCKACHTTPLKELVEVDAVGFSLCLIKMDLIKKLSQPYFITGTRNTEDVYFCIKAKEEAKKVSIFMDNTLKCGHMLNPEPIQWENRPLLKDYYEGLDSLDTVKEKKEEGRSKTYFDRNLQNLR